MKKILFALLVVAAAAIAAPPSTSAQSDPALVKVPFQFIVGDKVLPAGHYRIASDMQDPSLLVVSNLDGKPAASFAATGRVANPTVTDGQSHVQFKNFGGQYFLWRVAMPGRDDGFEISLTRAQAERTLAKLNLVAPDRGVPAK